MIKRKWIKPRHVVFFSGISFYFIFLYLSHALKNTASLRPWNSLHILRYRTGSIQRVIFHPAFPPLLASNYQNGAKTVCARFRNGAKVVSQRRESFLYRGLKTYARTAELWTELNNLLWSWIRQFIHLVLYVDRRANKVD